MIDASLLNLLPPLRRARGDRLYGADQKHWVDLWKQDGAWLFGHRPEGAAKEWKNQVDKGLALWAPSAWPRRLEAVVHQLLPGTGAVRVFRNLDRTPSASVWRPWEADVGSLRYGGVEPLRLVLPSGPAAAVALVWPQEWQGPVPDHEVTSPVEAASLVHAVAQLLRFDADPEARRAREAAAAAFDQRLGPSGLFSRQGLWFTVDRDRHSGCFARHLEAGFLLNPDPELPNLIPTLLSDGEWSSWQRVVDNLVGGS